MGIFDGVLLASDYDGTLRGSTLKVLPVDVEAISYFQKEGGRFILTTGRCYSTFFRQAKELPLESPCLLSNGATFCEMDSQKLLFNHDLPDRAPGDMLELAKCFPDLAFETYFGEDIYCYNPNQYTDWHMTLVKSTYTECPVEEMPTPWLKVLFEGEHATLAAVQQMVRERWDGYYECIFSNENLLELTAKGVHKGMGVLEAAAMLGIDREHVYCVGDNDNDLPMLRVAKIGFAPEGSVVANRGEPGVRIVPSCEEGCVAGVIAALKEIYG